MQEKLIYELASRLKEVQEQDDLRGQESFFGGIIQTKTWLRTNLNLPTEELVLSDQHGKDIYAKKATEYGPVGIDLEYNEIIVSLRSPKNGQTKDILHLLPIGVESKPPEVFESNREIAEWKKSHLETFKVEKQQLPDDPKAIIKKLSKIPILLGTKDEIILMLNKALKDIHILNISEDVGSDIGWCFMDVKYKKLIIGIGEKTLLEVDGNGEKYEVNIELILEGLNKL